ncbi:MAG: Fur family transcriptional regulator [Hyphomicrobiales bacterium]
MLRKAGLRPTRQRIALAELLFGAGHRHLTAEMLHEDAMRESVAVSLATIYNTLHQFTAAGFLREVIVDGSKTYFDTNVSAHHHFFVEDTGEIIDVPGDDPVLTKLPAAPAGMKVSRVDVIVRVRRVGH